MVIASWFDEQYVAPLRRKRRAEEKKLLAELRAKEEKRRAQMRAEGRAELIAEIEDWENRRREAEARGEGFDEPPPYRQNGSRKSERLD